MKVFYSSKFLKAVKKLPKNIQVKLDTLIEILAGDPFHTLLHTKPLTGELSGMYSFRVTRDWRVIFMIHGNEVVMLVTVGNRKDIYR